MRGKVCHVAWRSSDDVASLKRAYQSESNVLVKPRLHLLWLVRSGKQVQEATELIGVNRRTAGEWLMWYRKGGLDEIRSHRRGGYGKESRLSEEQKASLVTKAKEDGFVTIKEGAQFVKEQFGIEYTESGMGKVFSSLKLRKKVPRPRNAKATEEAQTAFQKGD